MRYAHFRQLWCPWQPASLFCLLTRSAAAQESTLVHAAEQKYFPGRKSLRSEQSLFLAGSAPQVPLLGVLVAAWGSGRVKRGVGAERNLYHTSAFVWFVF